MLLSHPKNAYFRIPNLTNTMTEQAALKTVALNDLHISLGGKMVPFAGYNMPVQYSNLIQEHLQVRNSVGVFDVS